VPDPLVSVLMPVYNGEQFLREAIDSILGQSFKDFEFLIIDDGSKDNSISIIESYNDTRIRFVRNETNLKLPATLNRGLNLAIGKYIARMDQDDISMPDRLEKQIAVMDRDLKVGICGSWIEVFGLGNYVEKYPTDPDSIKANLLFYNALAHPTVMMRKSLFDQFNLRYSMEYLHAEDYELWQRCSTCFRIVNIGEVLLRYRTSSTSYCRVFSLEQTATLRRIDERNLILLGIPVRDEYLNLQASIRAMQFAVKREILDQVAEWLEIILSANAKAKYCSEESLKRVVANLWFRICRHTRGLGYLTWCRFTSSPLSRFDGPGKPPVLYLFIACCQQEVKRLVRWGLSRFR